jgi:hypothetical protein
MAVQSRSIDSYRLQSPVLCNNISTTLLNGVYISQLIRYSRTSGSYDDFRDRVLLHDLVNRHEISVSQRTRIYSVCRNHNPIRSFPQSWLFNGVVTKLTRRVIHAEQELLTLPEHLSPPPVLVVFVLLDLCFLHSAW